MSIKGLKIASLTVRTVSGEMILDDVKLAVAPGELVAVVGRSGSGKTMMTRAILGLLPRGLNATGSIHLDGRDLTALNDREMDSVRGARIGMLFQQPKRVLNPRMSVGRQVREGLRARGRSNRTHESSEVRRLLAEVGLKDPARVAKLRSEQLSGGMAQRVMMAIAIAAGPSILLADEPTSSLDSILKAQTLQLIRQEQRARGLGVLLITHDLGSVSQIADRVVVLDGGRVIEEGATESLLAAPVHPITRELIAASTPTAAAGKPFESEVLACLQNVGRTFSPRRNPTIALSNVDLVIRRGEVLGVLGHSGSGKSTFARLLARMDRPDSGTVTLSADAATPTATQIILQEPFASFDPSLILRESLRAPLHRLDRDSADVLVDAAVSDVGLDPQLLERMPSGCSGGQLQRLAIARALLVNPLMLICDESTSALDTVAQRHILDLLLRLRDERGITLVVISHDIEVIRYVSNTVAVFYDTELVEHAPADVFFSSARHKHSRDLIGAAC